VRAQSNRLEKGCLLSAKDEMPHRGSPERHFLAGGRGRACGTLAGKFDATTIGNSAKWKDKTRAFGINSLFDLGFREDGIRISVLRETESPFIGISGYAREDKVTLITGGAAGIAKATEERFARRGQGCLSGMWMVKRNVV